MYRLLPFILISSCLMAQNFDFAHRLYYNYQNYKEESLQTRRFTHSEIVPLIDKLRKQPAGRQDKNIFTIKNAGKSAEGRDIFLISIGTGSKKVFLWSQMHGDESTATMAIFDIFNFFNADDDLNKFRKNILKKLTIYFIPMLNPDGAEIFKRRDNFDIDINRDAVRLQTPEGKILKNVFDEIKPDFGFNLHDQNANYSVGRGPNIAALSFLAPPVNFRKSVNTVRKNAIKLISEIYKVMSKYIPGHIAKYPDDFEPRAFGDNFQKWGTSTILIESGGWKNDPEKQFLRKLNFIALLSSFISISDGTYKRQKQSIYNEIPFNEELVMNTILRNLECERNGTSYKIDIGINNEELTAGGKNFFYRSSIEDIGDLSVYYAYNDFDFDGYKVEPGKIYAKSFNSISEIENLNFQSLYKEGYTDIVLNSNDFKNVYSKFPVNIWIKSSPNNPSKIEIESVPNLIIKKNDEIKYVVVNGFVYDISNSEGKILNGLVFH